MIWALLAFALYSFFQLFRSESALALSLSTVRVALVMVLFTAYRFHAGIPFAASIFIFAVSAVGAMIMMRRQTQVEDTQS